MDAATPPAPPAAPPPSRPDDKVQFRRIANADYANLDPAMRDQMVAARHQGIVRAAEPVIVDMLGKALATPRGVDPATGAPVFFAPGDLVVLCMHRDDPATPDALRDKWHVEGVEVGVLVSDRAQMAKGLVDADPEGTKRFPYRRAALSLAAPPPPDSLYIAVFDAGMCTVIVTSVAQATEEPPAPPAALPSGG